ncbi:MAG: hypothetical protein MI685_04575 [Chlorobiales bacterium]|nr:hypothetical protein [Chlorobiales bacterium]
MKNLVVAILIILPLLFFGCTKDARNDRDELGSTHPSFEDLSSFDKYGKYGNDLTLTEVKNFSIGQKNLDLRDAGVRLTEAAFIFCTHTAKPLTIERYKLKRKELLEREHAALMAEGMPEQEIVALLKKFLLWEMFFDHNISKVYYVDYSFVLRKRLSDDLEERITEKQRRKLLEEEMQWLFLIKQMVDSDISFNDIEFRCFTEGLGLHPEVKKRLTENGYFRAIKQLARK